MHYREVPFEWNGVTITDPTLDETGRFDVSPSYYYEEPAPMNNSVEAVVARAMSEQFFEKYAPSYRNKGGLK